MRVQQGLYMERSPPPPPSALPATCVPQEEGSDPSSGGEDEDGEGTVQPRYSRRNRQTVQRYSPRREVKPAPRSERRRRYEEDLGGLSDLEQVRGDLLLLSLWGGYAGQGGWWVPGGSLWVFASSWGSFAS